MFHTNGKALAWDATCITPLAASYVEAASRVQKAAVSLADGRKSKKYEGLLNRVAFVPLAMESTGAAGPRFLELLRDLAGRIEGRGSVRGAYRHLLRALSTQYSWETHAASSSYRAEPRRPNPRS